MQRAVDREMERERDWRLMEVAAISGGRGAPEATHVVVDREVVVDITGDSLSANLGVGCILALHFRICRRESLA